MFNKGREAKVKMCQDARLGLEINALLRLGFFSCFLSEDPTKTETLNFISGKHLYQFHFRKCAIFGIMSYARCVDFGGFALF